MRFLNKDQLQSIGFQYIIDNIDTISRLGHEVKHQAKPYTHAMEKELMTELSNTEKIIDLLRDKCDHVEQIGLSLHKIKDIKPTIKKIGTGVILDEVEFFEIKLFASICNSLSRSYASMAIDIEGFEILDVSRVFNILDPDKTGYETFYIYESYSLDLQHLRIKRKETENQIINAPSVDQKNKLLLLRAELLDKEHELEYQIKTDLTNQLKAFVGPLLSNVSAIGYLDFLIAKSRYFMHTNAVAPTIVKDSQPIHFEGMYNPYYDNLLKQKKASMQTLDLDLHSGVTVLTGANMGGKSITMKTVVLNVLLANYGMYVYADAAHVPIIEFLYMVSDDLQSIEKGLSTFGAEMIQLKTIIGASGKKDGLIVLDELARGTNPEEAKIIVNAVIDFFKHKQSYTFISTHLDGIDKEDIRHLQVVGISRIDFKQLESSAKINSKEALNLLRKQMDYSIEEVSHSNVPKNALQIARLLGIKDLNFDL